jgi:hypothetical protein
MAGWPLRLVPSVEFRKEAMWKQGSPDDVASEKGVSGMPLPREVKRTEITQQFRSYTLPGILPEGHVLVLNTHLYSLSTFVLT